MQLPGVDGVERAEDAPEFSCAPNEAGGVGDAGAVGEGVGHEGKDEGGRMRDEVKSEK